MDSNFGLDRGVSRLRVIYSPVCHQSKKLPSLEILERSKVDPRIRLIRQPYFESSDPSPERLLTQPSIAPDRFLSGQLARRFFASDRRNLLRARAIGLQCIKSSFLP